MEGDTSPPLAHHGLPRRSPCNTAKHLAKILHPLLVNTDHHVKNSDQFASFTQGVTHQPNNTTVIFDVLFTYNSTTE